MRRVVVPITLTLLAAGPVHAVAVARPSPPTGPRAPTVMAQPVLTGLNFPAAFTFDPHGRIFFGERFTGRIRIYDPATDTTTLFHRITSLATNGEQGLLGLALDPEYPARPLVFAYATRKLDAGAHDQILRFTDQGGKGTLRKLIFSSPTTSGQYHDGGRILFGPGGRLFAVQGEAHTAANAQNLSNSAGKMLRMDRNGHAPPGNPFSGKVIWAYGIRNSFGFTFDPMTGRLWETEAGPNCNDEINLIRKGQNYGWGPHETCSSPPLPPANTNQDGPDPVMPLQYFTPTITPVGTAFCDGCGLPGSEGHLFFGSYNDHIIHEAVLNQARDGITAVSAVYTHSSAVLSMERGPGGALYFSSPTGIYKLVAAA